MNTAALPLLNRKGNRKDVKHRGRFCVLSGKNKRAVGVTAIRS